VCIGEVWFGDEASMRMVNWLADHPELVDPSDSIIDSGTGNGMLCVDLAKEGFTNITGVDYCQEAIELARKVSLENDVEVTYEVGNILARDSDCLQKTYKVVTDKGTYDAISLSDTAKEDKEAYLLNTSKILAEDGFLVITSCNSTAEELIIQFKQYFAHFQTIPTPSFTFGGKTGSMVSTVIFKKQNL